MVPAVGSCICDFRGSATIKIQWCIGISGLSLKMGDTDLATLSASSSGSEVADSFATVTGIDVAFINVNVIPRPALGRSWIVEIDTYEFNRGMGQSVLGQIAIMNYSVGSMSVDGATVSVLPYLSTVISESIPETQRVKLYSRPQI